MHRIRLVPPAIGRGSMQYVLKASLTLGICRDRLPQNAPHPGDNIDWYWKLVPCILFSVGRTVSKVFLLELIIAQSPHKMKGFVIGMNLLFTVFMALFLLSATMKLG